MALFGKNQSDYMDDANKALDEGYQRESDALAPYTQNSASDFNMYRKGLYSGAQKFQSQPKYGKSFLDYLNMSPEELLHEAMGGYQESDLTKMQKTAANSAVENQALYKGMYGSGESELTEAEIDNILGVQGMGTYLKGLTGALKTQGSIYDRYAKKRGGEAKALGHGFKDIIGKESNASNRLAQDANRTAITKANEDTRIAASKRSPSLFRKLLDVGLLGLSIYNPIAGGATKAVTSDAADEKEWTGSGL